jgi:hypothetical protein
MKLIGLDYFGLDTSNTIIQKINKFCISYNLTNLWYFITLYIYTKVIASISLNRKTNILVTTGITLISLSIFVFIKPHLDPLSSTILDYLYLLIVLFIINKLKDKKGILKRYNLVVIANILFQSISLFVRNVGNNEMFYDNFVLGIIMNIDYILLSIIMYKIYFEKGGYKICGEVISFSQMKSHFSNLLEKLQVNYSNFKKYNKQYKATIIIYTIFSLIWNIFSVVVVLFVAKLNNTFVECIFILTSFWLSKKVFGKAFHLKSMIGCFILSNATYYVLNRITTPVGISILVPIMLGVGLSYITSKFVRNIKPLYKGMSEEEFENTILKVVDKDSDKYKICYDFFIKKENAISLGYKYNYTEAGIRKITYRINEKIKALD